MALRRLAPLSLGAFAVGTDVLLVRWADPRYPRDLAAGAPTYGVLLLARRSLIEPASDLRQPADGEGAKARQAGGRCQAGGGGTR